MNQTSASTPAFDAVVVVSFGGPEKREDVIPFLENVVRGRRVPRERLLEVAEHYYRFGGKSPINDQNRELVSKLQAILDEEGPKLPVYWGNRNWHPYLSDTVAKMRDDGVKNALAFVTSAYSSYSSCRQYREDIARACEQVGPGAPRIEKLRAFYNHPLFIEAVIDNVEVALDQFPAIFRDTVHIVFTAHSLPLSVARQSRYSEQIVEASRLVGRGINRNNVNLVYQSRSGPPSEPWLGPDICDYLKDVAERRIARNICVVPIGFVSDHMEVIYDLDVEAQKISRELGLKMIRARTVGTHPKFIEMVRELILERAEPGLERRAIGFHGPSHDVCPEDCCPSPERIRWAESERVSAEF